MPSPALKSCGASWGEVYSWLMTIRSLATRTLWECVPGTMPRREISRGFFGSDTSTMVVPSGLRMLPT